MSTRIKGFGFRRGQDFFRRHSRHGAKAGFKVQRLSQGIKTFCPPTADGGAKAGFKMQRLSQGAGAVLPDKPALGLNFDLKFNKPTWG